MHHVGGIAERCEEISLAGEGTSREMFHICCDITEKYLKQREKLLDLDSDNDDEAYYIPGSGLPQTMVSDSF